MDAIASLEALGLRPHEAKVYVTLHSLGESTAGKIAKSTGIHVRSVYDSLETLVGRGLVTTIEMDGAHYYSTAGLGAFSLILDEQKKIIENLDSLLPKRKKGEQPTVRVFRGKDGARSLLEEQLREMKTVYYYGATGALWTNYPLVMEKWNRQCIKLGLKVKTLAINDPKVLELFRKTGWETRIIPETSLTPWWKFGDCVVFPMWDMANPILIQINNADTARTHEYMFNSLWEKAKKLK